MISYSILRVFELTFHHKNVDNEAINALHSPAKINFAFYFLIRDASGFFIIVIKFTS